MGYLRGQANKAAGEERAEVDPGETGINIRVDGEGLDGAVEPHGIDPMVEEWRGELDAQDGDDQRNFTKDFITQTVALIPVRYR